MISRVSEIMTGSGLSLIHIWKRDSEQNVITYHGMRELPEYKELCKRYDEEEKKLEQYREECKNKAFDLFSKWFYDLWD